MTDRIYYSYEAEQQARRERLSIAVFAAAVGVGIGTLLAILFAPQKGTETREQVADRMKDSLEAGRDATQKIGSNAKEQATHLRDEIVERVESIRE